MTEPVPEAIPGVTPEVIPEVIAEGKSTRIGIAPPPEGSEQQRPLGTIVKLGPGIRLPGTAYRINGWLGDGATGVVYRARHIDLERDVALKILRSEVSRSPKIADMFRKEARNAGRIDSEFIVEVYDLGDLPDGRVWFAMPLLEGTSLAQLLKAEPVEPGRAIGLLRQICKGLAAAHQQNLIHRDVKPENIMLVTDRGRPDAVRMLDWGIAIQRADAMLGRGTTAGTPYYIAPELVAHVPYDHRVDIYSLGCTAFEVFAGRPPFTGTDLNDVLLAHVDDPAPKLREFAPDIPRALEAVIDRCLAKNPDDRYADAADLEAALCEAQIAAKLESSWDDLPLPDVDAPRRAALASAMPDLSGPTKSRWFVPALAGAAVALVIAASVWALSPDEPAPSDSVEDLAAQARAAAAKSFFLYPPADDPEAETAYDVVVELEALNTPGNAATAQALALRREFAETLTRLGDKYWAREGGRAFAVDYYAEAVVFVPDQAVARDRVSLTPGELATLRAKATAHEFSPNELAAVQPLRALAEEDATARAAALIELSQTDAIALSTASRLDRLVDNDPDLPEAAKQSLVSARAAKRDNRPPAPAAAAPPSAPEADTPAEITKIDPLPETPPTLGPDRAAAKASTERGLAALAAGRLGQAEREFQRALAADDRYARAHHGLNRLEFHRGNYARAARHGEKAVRLAGRNGKYRIDLGDAYYKAYRYADAKTQYQAAAKLGHSAAAARLAKADAKLGG